MPNTIKSDVKKVLHDISASIFSIRDISELLMEVTNTDLSTTVPSEVTKGLKNIYELSNTLSLYITDLKSKMGSTEI